MAPKALGHAFQLMGYALVFLGLAVAAGSYMAAGWKPAVPTWAFVAVGFALGAPLMVAGGRLNALGRGLLGGSPQAAAREYHEKNVLLSAYLLFLAAHGALVAAPLLVRATGLANPGNTFVTGWMVSWMLFLCATRAWIARPLWRAIERRLVARWEAPQQPPR